jgi:4-methyl-5(b-hydroxyethyl)-thiazole monophosphate biosynthesis
VKKVLLLLSNGFEAYEASIFTDVMGWSRVFGIPVKVITAGMHPKLRCTWNFTVIPEKSLKEINIDEYDALAIPGGFETAGFYKDAYSEDFLEVIRGFDRRNKIIAAICVGALPLGKSGILKGRSATTYPLPDGKRRRELAKFGAIVFDRDIVIDKNIITSAGPGTAVDVAFALLEFLTSKNNCSKIKELMGFKRFLEYKVFK